MALTNHDFVKPLIVGGTITFTDQSSSIAARADQYPSVETVKTVVQPYKPEPRLLELTELFRQMVNTSIAVGLETGRTSLKSLSLVSYSHLKIFRTDSRYRLCAISRAASILKNYRNLSNKHRVRTPYCRRAGLTICYGVKVNDDGILCLPGGFGIPLNRYVS